MFERIFENWKTSTLAIVLIVAGFVLVFHEKASLAELGGFLGVAIALFYSKDPKKDGKI
jgi:uncharacterized membrane protein